MPPSVRARRSRRGSDHEEASDGGVRGESTPSTPSRPMRKRQRTQTPPTKVSVPSKKKRSRGSEAPDGQAEEDASGPDGLLNSVIANLNAAPHPVNVAEEHGNAKLEREYKHGVQAYAKIAGVNWTYYVKSLKINIGRPPESAAPSAGTITQSSPVVAGPASTVNINLGPHKAVSRQHATIAYNPEGAAAGWQMSVYGRLGAKINDRKLEIGDTQALHSGDVLEIDGTQMMFVTPNDGPRIHPMFLPGSTAHAEQGENGVGSCDNDNDNDNDDDNDHNEEDDQSAVPAANTSRPRRSASLHHHHHHQQQRSGTANRALAQQPGSAAAAAAAGPKRPTTPGQANGSPEDQGHRSRPSPAYNRGLMLESTEGIDFSLESAKDFKPPFSYAAMIGQAIMASEEQKLTLNAIYQWIMDKYAFYRRSQSGWQNSIRHNLSLNKAFEKIPRRTDEPGKGMKWQIVPQHREEFTKRSLRPSTKGAHRTSSAPQSPAPKDMAAAAAAAASASAAPMASTSASASASAAAKTARTTTVTAPSSTMPGTGAVTGLGLALEDGREMSIAAAAMRLSPGSVTPPRHGSYPVAAREAYTPERGSHRPAGVREREDGTGSFADGSPMPMSRSRLSAFCSSTFSDGAQGSPLTLPSSAFMDESRPLITPAPRRQLVHLGPPSTAQVPSTFLPQSSPAPFWKYVDFGSTPAKPVPDPSPIKTGGGVGLQSSSPPPRPATFVDMESPSKATRADRDAGREGPADSGDDDDNLSDGDEPLDDMRGGIDLARGFQPIGSFQAKMTNAAV